ncbi:MAG: hypothetical protein GKS00_29925 [Alphaproteobacteria bacterium]|nr:hypothetical protein [Alphaproteobacteria bacterium]
MKDPEHIPALTPRGPGHQFVFYGDSCSGVPNAPHEETFAAVNAVVDRLSPAPDFIVFPGDEVIGLTADADALRAQWRHWLDVEMAWLNRQKIPLYHATSNHTTYDTMSEGVFAEMLPHLPRNGPPDQEGLSYFVRRGDLLMVFVHTSWSGLGGEGHVETGWLAETLRRHADSRYKLVIGHHPVFPVNGFSGAYQREIGPEHAATFWSILVENGVFAYLCSHILAFDVQVHDGVLQITSAGAGTAHRMPEGEEYLHCVQAALDDEGLRYQVLDIEGQVRERLSWPLGLPPSSDWVTLSAGEQDAPLQDAEPRMVAWRFGGCASTSAAQAQTLLSAWSNGPDLTPLWIGLTGAEQRLTVMLAPIPGRSPHAWFGPGLAAGAPFDIQLALHTNMGPGGVLWRLSDASPWNSLDGASSWGPERLVWPARWTTGCGQGGQSDRPFSGENLNVTYFSTATV